MGSNKKHNRVVNKKHNRVVKAVQKRHKEELKQVKRLTPGLLKLLKRKDSYCNLKDGNCVWVIGSMRFPDDLSIQKNLCFIDNKGHLYRTFGGPWSRFPPMPILEARFPSPKSIEVLVNYQHLLRKRIKKLQKVT